MSRFIEDALEMWRFVRIAGVRDFVTALAEACKDEPGRVIHKDFMVLDGEWSVTSTHKAACAALGLPDDWVYDEVELRKTRSNDPFVRCSAIATLMWCEQQRQRDARMKVPKLLHPPRKLLPGARP